MVVLQNIADIHNDCRILDDTMCKKILYNLNTLITEMLKTNPQTVIILHLFIYPCIFVAFRLPLISPHRTFLIHEVVQSY